MTDTVLWTNRTGGPRVVVFVDHQRRKVGTVSADEYARGKIVASMHHDFESEPHVKPTGMRCGTHVAEGQGLP